MDRVVENLFFGKHLAAEALGIDRRTLQRLVTSEILKADAYQVHKSARAEPLFAVKNLPAMRELVAKYRAANRCLFRK